jgi:hypothetical protein
MSRPDAIPNDTSTVLNPGVGGDTMDESTVTQVTTGTATKRARVAVGGDDGALQTFTEVGSDVAADVNDKQVLAALNELVLITRAMTGYMKLICSEMGVDVDLSNAADIGKD